VQGNKTLGITWPQRESDKKPVIYVFHFDADKTRALFELYINKPDKCHAFAEWQMTQFDALARRFQLLDGYASEATIPPGAHVFINWADPFCHLPWNTLKRSDIHKHTLLVESPNIRHTRQWSNDLLHYFTTVFTFWADMLDEKRLPMCKFARMNCHWLDFDNKHHMAQLVDNRVDDRSVAMILENRPLAGTFVVRDKVLHCQDNLREWYVKDLRNATVHGRGWDASKLGPGVTISHNLGRQNDRHSTIDILCKHTFGLVVENVDADGYVSEKLYDCLIAGCIPIYYGNNNDQVGIPKDLYIDLKQIKDSAELQTVLDTIDVAAFKQRIHERREQVLRNVSANAFADLLEPRMLDPAFKQWPAVHP
jgi:hypothetical protein